MTTIMLEGFDQIGTALALSAENVRDLFLAVLPDEIEEWFEDTGDEVSTEAAGRLAGQCLTFTRGANASPGWSADFGANLGFSFVPKQKITLGWAVQYSMVPTQPIPLACFRYDSGNGDTEQLSLWATPDGKVYVSTTPYTADYLSIEVGINPLAVTPSGTFRFTQWTYFEQVIDYSGDVPSVSILVNGVIVLDGIESETFLQMADDPYVSSAHIINPCNSHFGNAAFEQRVDDIYIDDEITRGPQWIVGLVNGAVQLNEGWTDVPSTMYPGAGVVVGDAWDDTITWSLTGMPSEVGVISAISVTLIGEQPEAIDAVTFGVCNASDAGQKTRKASFSAGDAPRASRLCIETPPTGLLMTGPSLSNMRGYLRASRVIV